MEWARTLHQVVLAAVIAATFGPTAHAAALAYIVGGSTSAGTLALLDTKTMALSDAGISIPANPRAVAVHPDGTFAYIVSLSAGLGDGEGQVTIVETATRAVKGTIPVGQQPLSAAISPDGTRLYVSNERDGTLSVIDTVSRNVIAVLPGGNGNSLVVSPSGERVYAATAAGLTVVHPFEGLVRKWILPRTLRGITISPDGTLLYATEILSASTSNLLTISTASESVVASVPIAASTDMVSVNSSGTQAYVAGSGVVTVVDTTRNVVIGTITVGMGSRALSLTPDGQNVLVLNSADSTVSVIETTTNVVSKTVAVPSGAFSYGSFIGPLLPPVNGRVVVEFYNASLDHYFITQEPQEIQDLDAKVHPGWKRTGQKFFAFVPGTTSGASPVCRFYGLPSAGLDSHFYSASPAECDEVSRKFAASWLLESREVMQIALPAAVTGACAIGTMPIYRLWNGRADSSHRYTASVVTKNEMLSQGYISEGYGPAGVAMCAPMSD